MVLHYSSRSVLCVGGPGCAATRRRHIKEFRVRFSHIPDTVQYSNPFLNLDSEGQVKFLTEETDRILGVRIIIGASSHAAPLCGSRCHRPWLVLILIYLRYNILID